MDEVIEEALEKHQGLVPLVYDAETMALEEARPQDMQYAVYLKREADKVLAEKDAEIARLNKIISDADKTSGEAVAELKEPYYTRCAICNKPWGTGELHALHHVTFHGRFVTSLFTCCDCARKIQEGEI